ncbi:hypothetical protein M413DRAFT_12563 [Hebeloma cylindrosporum]|uniref:F-box domain-containing protein n=1 Tax=Hebeloma cylindrosporum TaxID=76867 RepID=A0A0C3BPS8_HEBCY|nr:hypothetical protein M413DRAFT_12563 [Hebeloma cylindrosporum h7]
MSRFNNCLPPPYDNSFLPARATHTRIQPLQGSNLVNTTPRTRRFQEMVAKVEKESLPIQFQNAVSRLTPEVLTVIFQYLAYSVTRILTVSAVCRDWRNAARQCPKLWKNVSLKVSFRELDCTRLYGILPVFQLSKKEGINLEIQYEFSKTDLHMIYNQLLILPYKPRWKVLRSGPSCIQAVFGSERSFPLTSLEELIIEQRNKSEHRLSVSFYSAPNLKYLVVSIPGQFSTRQVVAPWKNLVSLNLDAKGSSCEDFLAILAQCSRLEACVLGFTGHFWPTLNAEFDRRLSFPLLRTFTLVGGPYVNPIPFLSWLFLPALKFLFIRSETAFHAASTPLLFNERFFGNSLVKFLHASRCNLRTFELHTRDLRFSELATCLRLMPLLQSLRLSVINSSRMPIFDQKYAPLQLGPLSRMEADLTTVDLPLLETFTIHGLYADLPILWFLEIVSQKRVKIQMPRYDERVGGCMTLTYCHGFLETVSGNPRLSATDIARMIIDLGFEMRVSII